MTTPRPWTLRAGLAALVLAAMLVVLVPPPAASQAIGRLDPTIDHEVLTEGYRDITTLQITSDGRVIFTEREGRIFIWKQDGTVVEAAFLPVDAYDRSQGGQHGGEATCPRGDDCPAGYYLAEGGVHGLLLAPDFDETGDVYIYYTPAGALGQPVDPPKMPGARGPDEDETKFRLSKFTLVGDSLDLDSEVRLFENPAYAHSCCHYGGDLEWLSDGTLLLTTGDDASSDFSSGYSPHDQRPGWEWNNADLTSQNLADRRGKILRLDVRDVFGDGSIIPPDNPFLDVAGADPAVYALGFRSPYRMAVNPDTDHVYVGNVSSDASVANPQRGPAGHDELEVVPPGGGTNHGWPRCQNDNEPYWEYDFETGESIAPFDCSEMTPAVLYYTRTPNPATNLWVQMGTGGLTIMGGTVYRRPPTGALRLPSHYDNQLIWTEYSRSQIWRTPVGDDGTLGTLPIELLPVWYGGLRRPIDSVVGPDGALYLAEYGSNIWNSTNGRISRLICAGCSPDPADYGGAAVRTRSGALSLAGLEAAPSSPPLGPAWLLVVAIALAGWRLQRRHRVI